MSNIPADLKYAPTHEWIQVDGDVATIGITDFVQSELGDVVYVDLPTVGRVLQMGESFASVESVKTVSDIYAPISGEVVETNDVLGAQSDLINTDPYGRGFLIKLRIADEGELLQLLDADAYAAVAN